MKKTPYGYEHYGDGWEFAIHNWGWSSNILPRRIDYVDEEFTEWLWLGFYLRVS